MENNLPSKPESDITGKLSEGTPTYPHQKYNVCFTQSLESLNDPFLVQLQN